MIALLQYLDLALMVHSWFSHYNSLDWTQFFSTTERLFIVDYFIYTLIFSWFYWYFINNSWSCNYYTVFHCIFMVFNSISFKPQKVWGLIVNLPLPIFSFLLFVVYPVGMTTYWCYFSWIIANNFASAYHILTKLGTKMQPYTTYLCTTFQGNLG